MPTNASSLQWKTHGPYQIATDGLQLHVREALESAIGGTLLALVLMAGTGYGGFRLVQAEEIGYRVLGGLLLLIAALTLLVGLRDLLGALGLAPSPRRPLLTLDRGDAAGAGSVHVAGRRVGGELIRCFTSRPVESGRQGELLRRMVVAELHDGSEVLLNLSGTPDWVAFYARQAAAWMGLPYEEPRR